MPPELPPPASPSGADARQRKILVAAIGFLILAAIVVAGFVRGIPLPVRLFIAVSDLVAAAALWLVLRQKFGDG